MPQLPVPSAPVWGASPSSRVDGAGVLYYSVFANKAQRVYKLVNGAAVEVTMEHLPTARGQLAIDSDGYGWLTAWDDGGAGLWRMRVPGWVQVSLRGPQGPQGIPGPKGDKGDPGPAGSGGGLSDTERRALDWLLGWLRPLLGG